jgi:hydroxymethylpyrimidine pyrophosphatase-like HAD family hydrolase
MLATDFDLTMGYYDKLAQHCQGIELVQVDYSERMQMGISMTVQAYEMFVELCNKQDVIVLTTRSKDEVNRLKFASLLPYIIHSNGATIEESGKEDFIWTNIIDAEIKAMGVSVNECIRIFQSRYGEAIEKVKVTNNSLGTPLYPNIRFNEFHIPTTQDISSFAHNAGLEEFSFSAMGNKLYAIPKILNKKLALDYLLDKLGISEYTGAGDSLDDYQFLKGATTALVSGYGVLYEAENQALLDQLHHSVIFTGRGTQTSEQMLQYYNNH